MSTDIVYRSVVKDTGEEVLVYRNIFDKYKDLKSNREFSDEELIEFISLSKMIGFESNVSKRSAIQLYYDCKNSLLEYHSVYVGDLAIVRKANDMGSQLDFEIEIIAKDKIFYKYGDEYVDLENYERYRNDNFKNEETVVINTILLKDRFHNELQGSRQSKQKILTFCQNKFSTTK